MKTTIGDAILSEIIKEDLVRAECEDVCVWKANAAEVLEAIVMNHLDDLIECQMAQRTCK